MENSEHSNPLLVAERFREDPRLLHARNLILEALKDHQSAITGIRPPQKILRDSFAHLLKDFQETRGASLYFPYIGSGFGKGCLVELVDGSVKYDMISGIGPHYWGHSDPQLILEAFHASLNDTVMQGNLQPNLAALDLSKLLIESSGFPHCFLSTSGAMANENALKIIFHKKAPAQRILAFEGCFMGRTLALSQITDKPNFREGLPPFIAVDYLPFYQADDPEKSTQAALKTLESHLKRYPGQHAALCLELIQGEGGIKVGNRDFFLALLAPLKQRGIAIFVDEIQTFGRTPQLYGFQHFDLAPYVDVISIGKLSQVCATLFSDAYLPSPGLLSQTFTGSSTAIHTGYWIIQQLLKGSFFGPNGKIERIHSSFLHHFQTLNKRYPSAISGPHGMGSMIAFTPFDGEAEKTALFVQELFQEGVISFVAGTKPCRVRFLVPIGAIEERDVDEVMKCVEKVLIKHL